MESNKDWASGWNPLPQRKTGSNKKNKENQAKIISQLKEMFGTTFELDILLSVADSCDWKLDAAIDALITMTSSSQTTAKPKPTYDPWPNNPEYDPWPGRNQVNVNQIPTDDFLNIDQIELEQQQEELRKFEQAKKTTSGGNDNESNQKVETASLCGLKVQYRPRGMENNSDDDADVVIEEESSDYHVETPEPECNVNVCQFLSAPTQCPPRNTFPKVNYMSTPSPPRTPRHIPTNSILDRIESHIDQGHRVMILMRGAPGSGKSYLARNIIARITGAEPSDHIFSSDDYFTKVNRGAYKFDGSRLQDAHAFNQSRVLGAVLQGWSPIIIDNTNTQAWEMQCYVEMAVNHGYIIETLEPNTSWSRSATELERRNRHHVSKAKIRIMLDRYEPDLNGERLLRMFKLKYSPDKVPPLIRRQPPLEDDLAQRLREVSITEQQRRLQVRTTQQESWWTWIWKTVWNTIGYLSQKLVQID